jgi:hypothetical protein
MEEVMRESGVITICTDTESTSGEMAGNMKVII